jgi:hypothetical protein
MLIFVAKAGADPPYYKAKNRRRPVRLPSSVLPLVTALAGAGFASQAAAASFDLGPFEATLRSNITLGASWRADDPSNRVLSPGNTDGEGRASASTTDDGNLNYDQGDMYSLRVTGLHDLGLNADNWGLFGRVKYWYDYAVDNDGVQHGHAANGYAAGEELNTSDFEDLAQEKGIELLDYYIYGDFEVGGMPLELRAGSMALNWGESLFIQNGVNIISPFDVTAIRRPGTEIREALLPVGMLYANIGLTYNLTVEAFYQYDWQRTILDECGTYWSAADPYGGGCDYLTAVTSLPDGAQQAAGLTIDRGPDDEPDDGGQYGISARYFMEALPGDAPNREAREYALEDARFALEDAERALQTGPVDPFLDVHFVDRNRGFAVGAYGLLFRTDDGGNEWRIAIDGLDNPWRYHYYDLHERDGVLYLSGEAGLLFVSRDGGSQWRRIEGLYEGSLFGLVDLGPGVAAFGLRGNVFLTEDGGDSWQPVPLQPGASLYGGGALAGDTAVLAGSGGTLVRLAASGEGTIYGHPERASFADVLAIGEVVFLAGMGGNDRLDEAAPQ